MELFRPRVKPVSKDLKSANSTVLSTPETTARNRNGWLDALIKLKTPKQDPELERYSSAQPSVPNTSTSSEHPRKASKRSNCGGERARDQHNEVPDIEVRQESSRQSAATESSSIPGNIFDEANNSINTSTDLSSAQSIVHEHDVQELGERFWVAPKRQLTQTHIQDWEMMRAWLGNTLRNLFVPPPGVDYRLCWEFMYAGESSSDLTPTVIIICCHESQKSQLQKILKKQHWPVGKKYEWKIIVDEIEDLSSSLNSAQISGIMIGSTFVVLGIMCAILYVLRQRDSARWELARSSSRRLGTTYAGIPASVPAIRPSAMKWPGARSPGTTGMSLLSRAYSRV
jgi:hypothetical protein